MFIMKLFQSKFIALAINEVNNLEDAIRLLSSIPTGSWYRKSEKLAIEKCFAEMQTPYDVKDVKEVLNIRFYNSFAKLNSSMEQMVYYLDAVSLDGVEDLEQALIVCEEAPHQIIPSDYYGEFAVETAYDRKALSKALYFVELMFSGIDSFNAGLEVLDEVVRSVNEHPFFKYNFKVTDDAIEIVLNHIDSLDQVNLLYETYRRCGCISFTALRKIKDKYLEIGVCIVNQLKTVDDLINSFSTIPNLQSNLHDYIVSRIDEVGLSSTEISSTETAKLVEYDKKLPDCRFKTAIRDELVGRIDATKK